MTSIKFVLPVTISFQSFREVSGKGMPSKTLSKLVMLEFWKDATDKTEAFGALLTDLWISFDSLCHDLLIAKLHAYDLDIASLNLFQDFLSNCKQRTKEDSFFSS